MPRMPWWYWWIAGLSYGAMLLYSYFLRRKFARSFREWELRLAADAQREDRGWGNPPPAGFGSGNLGGGPSGGSAMPAPRPSTRSPSVH
jgi:hypothetical protein